MQITVVVCDRCKTRHELNQDAQEHGHSGPWRLPPGWSHIQIAKAPMVGAVSAEAVEDGSPAEATPEQRAMAITGLKHFVSMLEDPNVDAKMAKQLMHGMVTQFKTAIDFDEESISRAYRRYGHGDHLPIDTREGVFCAACAPTMTAADGTPFIVPSVDSYGSTIAASPMTRGISGTQIG